MQSLVDSEEIKAIEIGTFQGLSSCWLLDHILTHSTAKLTCIDTTYQQLFQDNIARTNASNKVKKLKGDPHPILSSLEPNSYDLIHIRDRCKQANHVQKDAHLAFQLLKVGGLMIFSQYKWGNSQSNPQGIKAGIDAFLDSFNNQVEILHEPHQLIVKKEGDRSQNQ